MSPDKADPEVPAAGEHSLRKRFALISASVLLVTAGAFAYHRNASEGEPSLAASGAGLRLPQGRRLPHYTTYGGTSYDFKEAGPPAGCCCVEKMADGQMEDGREAHQCQMKFEHHEKVGYNPTMPPLGIRPRPDGYNPTRPPMFPGMLMAGYNPTMPPLKAALDEYNPTRPPLTGIASKEAVKALSWPDPKRFDNDWAWPVWKELPNKGSFAACCCSNELFETAGQECTVGFLSRTGTWP